jgi:hypothetical protein
MLELIEDILKECLLIIYFENVASLRLPRAEVQVVPNSNTFTSYTVQVWNASNVATRDTCPLGNRLYSRVNTCHYNADTTSILHRVYYIFLKQLLFMCILVRIICKTLCASCVLNSTSRTDSGCKEIKLYLSIVLGKLPSIQNWKTCKVEIFWHSQYLLLIDRYLCTFMH